MLCYQGVRTICLHLNNLELGDYTFTLKVMDTSGSIDDADVHVYVKPGEFLYGGTRHLLARESTPFYKTVQPELFVLQLLHFLKKSVY